MKMMVLSLRCKKYMYRYDLVFLSNAHTIQCKESLTTERIGCELNFY